MKKNFLIIVLAVLGIVAVASIVFFAGNTSSSKSYSTGPSGGIVSQGYQGSDPGSPGDNLTAQPGSGSSSESLDSINRDKLATHNTMESCWIAYKGKVYDITSWLKKHPGGIEAILPYCGTAEQFEQAFTKQHGTTKVALLMKVGILIGDFQYQGQLQ